MIEQLRTASALKKWTIVVTWSAVAAVALIALVDLVARQARTRDELQQAAADVHLAALWESSQGQTGTVRATVVDECSDFEKKLERYSRILFIDDGLLGDYRECPAALLAAVHFYSKNIGGEYGCTVARRALAALLRQSVESYPTALAEVEKNCR